MTKSTLNHKSTHKCLCTNCTIAWTSRVFILYYIICDIIKNKNTLFETFCIGVHTARGENCPTFFICMTWRWKWEVFVSQNGTFWGIQSILRTRFNGIRQVGTESECVWELFSYVTTYCIIMYFDIYQ